jgi:hypothetical protein
MGMEYLRQDSGHAPQRVQLTLMAEGTGVAEPRLRFAISEQALGDIFTLRTA